MFYTAALYTRADPGDQLVSSAAMSCIGCLAFPVSLALGIYGIYLGYLAARSSMNLDQNKAIITVVLRLSPRW